MNILITTGGECASRVVMESLAKQGHDIYLLDDDIYSAGFHSRYCKEGILCAAERDGGEYIESMLRILKPGRFDLLIPMSDFTAEHLSAERERILPLVKMFLPSKELVELACCKDKTYRFALSNDIDIPETYFPQSLRDVRRCAQKAAFPCVVKKSRGSNNKGNAYFYDQRSLIWYFERLEPLEEWPVIQEYVYGEFFGFVGVGQEGEIVDGFIFKTDQKYGQQGTPPYCESAMDADLLKTVRHIIKSLNWTGPIDLDFLKDRKGRIRLLEINPRLSAEAGFAYKLGVDLPAVYAGLLRGRMGERFRDLRYRPGVAFRSVTSELNLALNDSKYFVKMFTNFLNPQMRDDIPWDDPNLLAWDLRHAWWHWREHQAKGPSKKPWRTSRPADRLNSRLTMSELVR